MKAIAGFLLTFASVISYFYVATEFALYQPVPIAHFLVAVVGAVLAFRALKGRSGWRRVLSVAAFVATVGLTCLFVWYTLDYSAYASTDVAVSLGQELGEELAAMERFSHEEASTQVFEQGASRGTLYVFYRGFW